MPTGTVTAAAAPAADPAAIVYYTGRGYTLAEATELARHLPPPPAVLHPHDCPDGCGVIRGEECAGGAKYA